LLLSTLLIPVISNAQSPWKTHTPPFPDTIGIADIEVVNKNVIWAVGYRYGVDDSLYYYGVAKETFYAVTTDGGATWKVGTVPLGPKPFVANITATDGGQAFVAGLDNFGNAKTLKTIDGGTTWTATPNNWDPVLSWPDYIHAYTPARVTVIGDPINLEFEIYNTFNAGMVWQKVPGSDIPDALDGEFGFNNFGAAIGLNIWFGTNLGRLFHSENGGISWNVLTTPLGADLGSLALSDLNNWLITTAYGFSKTAQYYRTSDGGSTWTKLTNLPYDGHFLNFGTAAYIPNQPYILQGLTPGGNLSGPYETWLSRDRGDTWEQISSGELIGWPTFLNDSVGWAGDFQQLSRPTQLYEYIGSPLVGLLSPHALPAEITLSPNPTSDLLRVHVKVPEPGDFILLLNDAQGRLLQNRTVRNAADFTEEMAIGNLPTGIYMLTVSGKGGSITRQVVKL
ncbi:MAG: T9SS type A sorting domain-containing protein, partial [Saprospiraceae bacterium]